MKPDYKAIALEMNRLYCIGEGHLASDLLLDAINSEKLHTTTRDYLAGVITNTHLDYLLAELDQTKKQLATLTTEIEKWTKTK